METIDLAFERVVNPTRAISFGNAFDWRSTHVFNDWVAVNDVKFLVLNGIFYDHLRQSSNVVPAYFCQIIENARRGRVGISDHMKAVP